SDIGIVSRILGQTLQSELKPGQRLVSVEGDVWRWDGFAAAADAPSAAAKRLAERNRLSVLVSQAREAADVAHDARTRFEARHLAVEAAVKAERERHDAWRAATQSVEVARRALAAHERRVAERLAQSSAFDEARRRIEQSLAEAHASLSAAESELQGLPPADDLARELASLRDAVAGERA